MMRPVIADLWNAAGASLMLLGKVTVYVNIGMHSKIKAVALKRFAIMRTLCKTSPFLVRQYQKERVPFHMHTWL